MKIEAGTRLRASEIHELVQDPNTPTDRGQTFVDLTSVDPTETTTQQALTNDGSIVEDEDQDLLIDDLSPNAI